MMQFLTNMNKSAILKIVRAIVILVAAFFISYYVFISIFELNPENPSEGVDQARESYLSGELETALSEYTEAINEGKDLASAYAGRGVTFMQLRRFRDAIDDFTRSLEYELNAEVLSNRCNAYRLTADLHLATRDCVQALELDTTSVQAHVAYSMLLVEQEQYFMARDQANLAIELDPTSSEAFFALSQLEMAVGDPTAAIEALSNCIEVDITDPICYWHRGFLYSSLGQIDNAIQDMKSVLDNGDPEIHGQLMLEAGTVMRQYGVDPDQD